MGLKEAHKSRLRALHKLATRQGDSPNITLLKKDNSAAGQGSFTDDILLTDYWALVDVRPRTEFGQVTAENQLAKRFEVAEDQLTPTQAESRAAILHGSWRYTVELGDEPHGTSRYWVFKVLKREKV